MTIDYSYAFSHKIVYLYENDYEVFFLSKEDYEDEVHDYLQKLTSKKVNIIRDKKYNFEKYFEEYYSISNTDDIISSELKASIDSSIDKLFAYILKKAHNFNSSDIHILSWDNDFIIKFRINSILRTFTKLDYDTGQALIRIIKLKSNIDISKTITVLEGRFNFKLDSQNIDYRLSIIPTINGEKLNIRILGNTMNIYDFSDMGFNEDEKKLIKEKITKNSGFILITGPTNSGKSTTLFTILHYLNTGTKNIISIEDPVEYKINGVTQISVNKEKHIEFHNILKFVLRQDPQIINIGEIRDDITAKLAVNASNTGHLVLSTMHTNDSISSIQRLYDLGVESFDIISSLSLIISQRLIRVLCPNCKKEYYFPENPYGIK
ncbi:MAG: GspE/PulE family protein, partial [Peptoanaerobacter stomatis]|uniref:GspE/PulE family protein n=1 Tax=Peptoanaerobacter stomatis TaxID=796937 RepID=UPI003FA09813